MTVIDVMVSDPHESQSRFLLSLEEQQAGSPTDPGWDGTCFRAHGLSRARMVELLQRLAQRLEAGEEFREVVQP